MSDESITAAVTECRERVSAAEDLRLIEVTQLPGAERIELASPSLADAVALARDLGSEQCYLELDRTRSGDLLRAVVAFYHDGVLHAATQTPDRERSASLPADEHDPADEDRLAHIVFRDGRFNDAYTAADTELLLNALDIDYDEDAVNIHSVHEKAMDLRQPEE